MGGNGRNDGPNLKLWMPLFFIIGIGMGLLALNTGVLEDLELPRLELPLTTGADNAVAGGTNAPTDDYQPMLCDREAADAVREKARRLAAFRDQGERLTLTLGPAWTYYSEGLRQSFVETFHEADGCLRGEPRHIEFYYHGKRVAEVSPEGQLRMGDGLQAIQ